MDTIPFRLRKNPTSENNKLLAERKREKWSHIPGFLVTLVDGQPDQEPPDAQEDPYATLDFVGPATEEQFEDVSVQLLV